MNTSLLLLALSATALACGGDVSPPSTGAAPSSVADPRPGSPANRDRTDAPDTTTSQPDPPPSTRPVLAPAEFSGCSATTTPSCGAAQNFGTAAELVAIVDALPWQRAHAGSAVAFTVSADLVATADVTVSASLVAPTTASNCPSTSSGSTCASTVFRNGTYATRVVSVPTVVCNGKTTIPRGSEDGCASLTIPKGTHLRMRKVVEDVHPYSPTYRPIVEVERPCTETCADDEARCGTSQTCFKKGEATCVFCHAQSIEACACHDVCSIKSDDVACYYATSPDTMVRGVCRAGSCAKQK